MAYLQLIIYRIVISIIYSISLALTAALLLVRTAVNIAGEYKVCNCGDKAHFVALCALGDHFLGDANPMPNVLISGLLVGSPSLKCLLHTQVKSNLNSLIQGHFLLRSDGNRWKVALESLALEFQQMIQRSPGITTALQLLTINIRR